MFHGFCAHSHQLRVNKIPHVLLLHFFWLSYTKDKFTKGQFPFLFSCYHSSLTRIFYSIHTLLTTVECNGETVVHSGDTDDDTGVRNAFTLIKTLSRKCLPTCYYSSPISSPFEESPHIITQAY